ncbi:PhzF family phenazine biosynthesis isomerase [Alicyclobacillus contaminans]|uniref:PhzF family phenazine biosynthesis protein n=1 Tax=Alicyclobacillus contaminans TaxID=392016 RepID=UPI00316AE02F
MARIFGMNVSDIASNYPIRLGYTGNWHLLVPVASRAAIDAAQPHLTELAEMNAKQQSATTHLFTFSEEGDPYDIYTRDFGPAVGIPEDPVTGAANGALAGYLVLEGILNSEQRHSLRIAQGDSMGRPGMVFVDTIPGDSPEIRVGGTAVITGTGQLQLD